MVRNGGEMNANELSIYFFKENFQLNIIYLFYIKISCKN